VGDTELRRKGGLGSAATYSHQILDGYSVPPRDRLPAPRPARPAPEWFGSLFCTSREARRACDTMTIEKLQQRASLHTHNYN